MQIQAGGQASAATNRSALRQQKDSLVKHRWRWTASPLILGRSKRWSRGTGISQSGNTWTHVIDELFLDARVVEGLETGALGEDRGP